MHRLQAVCTVSRCSLEINFFYPACAGGGLIVATDFYLLKGPSVGGNSGDSVFCILQFLACPTTYLNDYQQTLYQII